MAKGGIINELSRLISRPKVTFEKGLIDVDRDAINGYVSKLENMEIHNSAVVKRKGSIVMNDNTAAKRWMLLEEINISGSRMILAVDAKRYCYVISDTYPGINMKLCVDGADPIFTDGGGVPSFHMQFKTGSKFWLLDTGAFYIVVSDTGEAYRIRRDGVVRFSSGRNYDDPTTSTDVENNITASRSSRDIRCWANIITATNEDCRGAFSADIEDPRLEEIRGDMRFAYMNDAGVISKFSDISSYPTYAKRVFSPLPLVSMQTNKIVTESEAEENTSYVTVDGGTYTVGTSFTASEDIKKVGAFIFHVTGSVESSDWDWSLADMHGVRPTLQRYIDGETQDIVMEDMPIGTYLVIPRLDSGDTACLENTTGFVKITGVSVGDNVGFQDFTTSITSILNRTASSAYDGSMYRDTHFESFGIRISTIIPYSWHQATNYNVISNDCYSWQMYGLEVTDDFKDLFNRSNTGIANVTYSSDPTPDYSDWNPNASTSPVVLLNRFFGVVAPCEVALVESSTSGTSYDLPAVSIAVKGSSSDVLVKATNKCGNHWELSSTTFYDELTYNGFNMAKLSFTAPKTALLAIPDTDTDIVKDEQLKRNRLVVWNDGDVISIAQKGYGHQGTHAFDFIYGSTVSTLIEGNTNFANSANPVIFNSSIQTLPYMANLVRKITCPVTWSKNKNITSFPHKIPSFQALITAAEHIVFNSGKVFVVQGNRLWIGNEGLVLTNPVEIDSTIEHMTAIYDGVMLFTEKGISRVNGDGKLFRSATRRAKKVISSGEQAFFVDDKGMVVRGKLMFSENNVPFLQFDEISEAIQNIEFGDDPEMTFFDDMLFISDGENVYRFNNSLSIWDKHIAYEKKIRKLSHYRGNLVTFIYDNPDRFNSFYIAPVAGGSD